jgi:surfeit locus 1 family protein
VRGAWDNRNQMLLDNQIAHGEAGYFVYAPLRIDGCGCAMLVNRGWIPAGPDRQTIPDIGFAPTQISLRGIAAPAPASGFGARVDSAEAIAPGVLRVQRLDTAELSQWLGTNVLPLTLLLDPAAANGYRREWQPPAVHADRHFAYAVQWFLFALITLGLAIKLNSRRR